MLVFIPDVLLPPVNIKIEGRIIIKTEIRRLYFIISLSIRLFKSFLYKR